MHIDRTLEGMEERGYSGSTDGTKWKVYGSVGNAIVTRISFSKHILIQKNNCEYNLKMRYL